MDVVGRDYAVLKAIGGHVKLTYLYVPIVAPKKGNFTWVISVSNGKC